MAPIYNTVLFLTALVLTVGSTNGQLCYPTCNQVCDSSTFLCNLFPIYRPSCVAYTGFCRNNCARTCACQEQCELDCVKIKPFCTKRIPAPLDIGCSIQQIWCRTFFCPSRCSAQNNQSFAYGK